MHQDVISQSATLYGVSSAELITLTGGHNSLVFEFTKGASSVILRITPSSDESDITSAAQTQAWLTYLGNHEAAVPKTVCSTSGKLIELIDYAGARYLVTAFTKAPGVLAEDLLFDRWRDSLYACLGRAVGKLHALATRYYPAEPALRRPEWNQFSNCYHPIKQMDNFPAIINTRWSGLLESFESLPKDRSSYGMIHADLHCGNIYVDVGHSSITVFDFDDCCYGWYAMDIAMNLFDLVVLCPRRIKRASQHNS